MLAPANNQDIEQIIEPDEIIIPDEVKPDNDEAVAYLTMGYTLPITNDFAIHLRPKYHIYLCYDCMCKVNSTLLEMGWKPKKQEEPNGGK